MKRYQQLAMLAVSTMMLASAHAQTVAWGTSLSVNPLSFTSNGTVDNQTLHWGLGWFTDGYTPTAANWSTWAANWNPVNYASAGSTGDLYHEDIGGLWAVSVNTADVGAAAYGKQAYIFAYNDTNLFGTSAGEALLFREDGLTFPGIKDAISFDIADNKTDPADDNFTVIWGRVDRDMYNVGGLLQGGGVISSYVPDSVAQPEGDVVGTFEAQSATWAVVPEASTSLLSLLGAACLLRRKRSN